MKSIDLYHDGVKGMRWGVRRFQNKDGSLTSAGKQRSRLDLDKTKSTLDETGKIVKSFKDIDDSLRKESAKKRTDMKKMSDEELRAKVSRLNLEKSYSSLTEVPVSKGRQYVRDALDIGGSVIAIGASSVAIAVAMKQLKG